MTDIANNRPGLEVFSVMVEECLVELFDRIEGVPALPHGFTDSCQPETNAFGLHLAHVLAKSLSVAKQGDSYTLWSSPKRLSIVMKVFTKASVTIPLETGEGGVDTVVWGSFSGVPRLVLASECEANDDQWCKFDPEVWWNDGYLWDMSKLCTLKYRNLLFVARARKSKLAGVKESIERFFREAPRPDYQLDTGQVMYLVLLAAGKTETRKAVVGQVTVLWDGEPHIEWDDLVP